MIELKQEINELSQKLGEPLAYALSSLDDDTIFCLF